MKETNEIGYWQDKRDQALVTGSEGIGDNLGIASESDQGEANLNIDVFTLLVYRLFNTIFNIQLMLMICVHKQY